MAVTPGRVADVVRTMGSGKGAGALLGVAALAVGAAAALGGGYAVAHATLSDGSAFLAKGDAVAHVNGEAAVTDATSKPVIKPGDPQSVISLPGGDAASIDQKTHTLTVMDGATMTPTATVRAKGRSAPTDVVASGSVGWLIDPGGSTVTTIAGGRPGRAVHLASAPVDAAPGPDNSVIVLGANGLLSQVDTNGTTHPVETAPSTTGALTRAGNQTYLVTGTGSVVDVSSAPTTVASLLGIGPGPSGRMLVGSLQGSGPHVLVLSGDTLAVVDPATGRSQLIALHTGTDVLGQPAEFGSDVYVPDFTAHDVVRVDEQSHAVTGRLSVPGTGPSFALFVSGGKLWANDQYAENLLVVDRSGTHRQVDKGPGDGVHGTGPKPSVQQNNPPLANDAGPGPVTRPPAPVAAPPVAAAPGVENQPSIGPAPGPPDNGAPGSTGNRGRHAAGNPGHGPPAPSAPPKQPPAPPTPTPKQPPPAAPPVTVPSFPSDTSYQDACNQLQAIGLKCSAVAAGTDHAGATGTVIDTTPAAGSRVTVGSLVVVSYVGPASVPLLPSGAVTPKQECQLVEAAQLTCDPQPSRTPATDSAQFGTVSDLNPKPGQSVDKGTPVTVFYYDSFPMPDVTTTHQSGATVCSQISALELDLPGQTEHPSCTSKVGTQPTNNPANAGLVYQQSPAASTAVQVGDAVTLTVWPGSFALPDWASQRDAQGLYLDAAQVQAQCLQAFTGCTLVTGDSPAPPVSPSVHPADAGRFEKTSPGPGTYPVGTAVTIYVWSSQNVVPNVTGMPIDQACAAITAAGFACDSSQHPLSKTVGTALSQSPAAGAPATFGSAVSVPNANIATTFYRQYIAPNDVLNIVVPEGQGPPTYTPGRVHFYAYAPGAIGAAGVTIDEYDCSKQSTCGVAVAYLPAGSSKQGFVDHGPAFQLMPGSGGTCDTAGGQTHVWEQQHDASHMYISTDAFVDANDSRTLIGCAWKP